MVDAPGLLWMSRPGAIAFAEWYSKQGTYARRLHNTLTTSATSAIQHSTKEVCPPIAGLLCATQNDADLAQSHSASTFWTKSPDSRPQNGRITP